jgi:hypothetical protein
MQHEIHIPLQYFVHRPLIGPLNVNLALVAVGVGIKPRVAAVAEVSV